MPTAYVLITTQDSAGAEKIAEIGKNLHVMEGVQKVSFLFGIYDLMVIVHTDTMEQMQETVMSIKMMDGVKESLTLIEVESGSYSTPQHISDEYSERREQEMPMAEQTFTSVHYAEPSGTGPLRSVKYRAFVGDQDKITPELEEEMREFVGSMDASTIEYWRKTHDFVKKYSKVETKEFHEDTDVIDMHQMGIVDIDLMQLLQFPKLKILVLGYNPILFIDLSPLAKCTMLEELLLDKCRLMEIDLTFLSSCPQFRLITLRDDPIKEINLSPLQHCPKFEVLDLEWNQLTKIDLSPLKACRELRFVGLQHNSLEELDLSPLANCGKLEVLYLHGNKYGEIDVRPLVKCLELKDCRVDAGKVVKLPSGQENIQELDRDRNA